LIDKSLEEKGAYKKVSVSINTWKEYFRNDYVSFEVLIKVCRMYSVRVMLF